MNVAQKLFMYGHMHTNNAAYTIKTFTAVCHRVARQLIVSATEVRIDSLLYQSGTRLTPSGILPVNMTPSIDKLYCIKLTC